MFSRAPGGRGSPVSAWGLGDVVSVGSVLVGGVTPGIGLGSPSAAAADMPALALSAVAGLVELLGHATQLPARREHELDEEPCRILNG